MSPKRITQKEIKLGFRADGGWRPDFHDQSQELRSATVLGGAITIREERHTFIKTSSFRVTAYTGDPKAYWDSESFESLKLAVQNANKRAPAAVAAYTE